MLPQMDPHQLSIDALNTATPKKFIGPPQMDPPPGQSNIDALTTSTPNKKIYRSSPVNQA